MVLVHEGNTKAATKMIQHSKSKTPSTSEVIFHVGDIVKIARGNPTALFDGRHKLESIWYEETATILKLEKANPDPNAPTKQQATVISSNSEDESDQNAIRENESDDLEIQLLIPFQPLFPQIRKECFQSTSSFICISGTNCTTRSNPSKEEAV